MIISFFYTMERIWLLLIGMEWFLGGERMAIGKYKNIMRSAPFVTTVNELNFAIGEEKKNIIAKLSNNKSAFNTQLTQAQAKQMQLFRELGIKTSAGDSQTALMELNKRIRDYQQITLNLSRRGLYKNFMMSLE